MLFGDISYIVVHNGISYPKLGNSKLAILVIAKLTFHVWDTMFNIPENLNIPLSKLNLQIIITVSQNHS